MVCASHGSKKRFKLTLFFLGIAIALMITGFFVYYMVKHFKTAEHFQQALVVFEHGDYAKAETLFLECINEDKNNEQAWAKLAIIYSKNKRWQKAAQCWFTLKNLNQLDEQYIDLYMESLLQAQAYKQIINESVKLSDLQKKQYREIIILAYLINKQHQDAANLLIEIPTQNQSDRIRIARLYLDVSLSFPNEKNLKELDELLKSNDDIVRYIALSMKFSQALGNKQEKDAEKFLNQMKDIYPEFGWALLGDFYYSQAQYDLALAAYQNAMNLVIAQPAILRYAEVLTILGKKLELEELAKRFQEGDKNIMQCGFFIESLIAYMDNNVEKLGEKLQTLEGFSQSPLFLIMRFDYAMRILDYNMLLNASKEIFKSNDLKNFYQTATEKLYAVIKDAYDQKRLAEVAQLAEWLRNLHPDDMLLNQVVILNKGNDRTVTSFDIESYLQKFPNDPVILTFLIDYAAQRGDFKNALKWATINIENGNDSIYTVLQLAYALEGNNKIVEARSKIIALREKYPNDLFILKRHIVFCIRNQDSLPVLDYDNDQFKPLVKFIQGENAFRMQNKQAMIDAFSSPLLSQLNPENSEELIILYHVAMRLAEADVLKTAIDIYQKIKPVLVDQTLVNMNLSELYAAAGDKAQALKEAQTAYLNNSMNPIACACYGLRLSESGSYKDCVDVLGPILNTVTDPRVLLAWVNAMERQIIAAFNSNNFDTCLDLSQKLLIIKPDNEVAKDYVLKSQNK